MPSTRSSGTAAFLAACLIAAAPADSQWLNFPTPGLPRTTDGTPDLSAPAAIRDGHPDLTGVWTSECGIYGRDACFPRRGLFFDLARDLAPEEVTMTPWAAGIAAQRSSRDHVDDPLGYCLPPGFPRITFGGGPFKIQNHHGWDIRLGAGTATPSSSRPPACAMGDGSIREWVARTAMR